MSDAPSYITAFIADQQKFNIRCQIIAIQYAVNVVLTESASTPSHDARRILAVSVIQGRTTPKSLAQIVLTDPNIQAAAIADLANDAMAVADVNIDGRIQAVWNSLALAAV